jgi:hypothetical protein
MNDVKKVTEETENVLRKRIEEIKDALTALENSVEELPGTERVEELEDALAKEREAHASMTKRRDEALAATAEAWRSSQDFEKKLHLAEAQLAEALETMERVLG